MTNYLRIITTITIPDEWDADKCAEFSDDLISAVKAQSDKLKVAIAKIDKNLGVNTEVQK